MNRTVASAALGLAVVDAPGGTPESARQVLHHWQQAGSNFPASDYIQRVWERALEADKTGKSIDVGNLPGP